MPTICSVGENDNEYRLIFEGPLDESVRTLQRIKGAFVADLDFPADEVRRILSEAPTTIFSSPSESDAIKAYNTLKRAGGKVLLVRPKGSEVSTEHLTESSHAEHEFVLDFSDLEKNAPEEKPAAQKVYTLDVDDVLFNTTDTSTEDTIDSEDSSAEAIQDKNASLFPGLPLIKPKRPDAPFDKEQELIPKQFLVQTRPAQTSGILANKIQTGVINKPLEEPEGKGNDGSASLVDSDSQKTEQENSTLQSSRSEAPFEFGNIEFENAVDSESSLNVQSLSLLELDSEDSLLKSGETSAVPKVKESESNDSSQLEFSLEENSSDSNSLNPESATFTTENVVRNDPALTSPSLESDSFSLIEENSEGQLEVRAQNASESSEAAPPIQEQPQLSTASVPQSATTEQSATPEVVVPEVPQLEQTTSEDDLRSDTSIDETNKSEISKPNTRRKETSLKAEEEEKTDQGAPASARGMREYLVALVIGIVLLLIGNWAHRALTGDDTLSGRFVADPSKLQCATDQLEQRPIGPTTVERKLTAKNEIGGRSLTIDLIVAQEGAKIAGIRGDVTIAFPSSPELTPEQIIHDEELPPWLKKADTQTFELLPSSDGWLIALGATRLSVEANETKIRSAGRIKLEIKEDLKESRFEYRLTLVSNMEPQEAVQEVPIESLPNGGFKLAYLWSGTDGIITKATPPPSRIVSAVRKPPLSSNKKDVSPKNSASATPDLKKEKSPNSNHPAKAADEE